MVRNGPGDSGEDTDVEAVSGVTPERAQALRLSGYRTASDLRAAGREELAAVDGVSGPLADHILSDVRADEDGSWTEPGRGSSGSVRESGRGSSGSAERRYLYLVILASLALALYVTGPSGPVIPLLYYGAVIGVVIFAYDRLAPRESRGDGARTVERLAGASGDDSGHISVEARRSLGTGPYFAETATPPTSPTRRLVVAVVLLAMVAHTVTIGLLFVLASPRTVPDLPLGIGAVVLLGGLWWAGTSTTTKVRVTDDGVEIDHSPAMPLASTSAFVPYDDVVSVRYREPTPRGLRVTTRDRERDPGSMRTGESYVTVNTGEHRSIVLNVLFQKLDWDRYRGGVRVERTDDPPLYVGSKRPVELAVAIAAGAPSVGAVEPLDPPEGDADPSSARHSSKG